ncbi:bifunctional proline dehydrogenase/L-glutamate gamma-semialdehyde dehydrogenase PutA [Falsihalocynthiibacter sp. S25ZX9]|uniref:bifunctional proline dehydrogenase/L-glutamate gamma-semialdehyde dehydrogenase PutA n=1 Tax=Falsihalocynthiibacter sp. S25ZX9 TaxID=3240870 RepID=UPI00350F60F1
METISDLRSQITQATYMDQEQAISRLRDIADLDASVRAQISEEAAALVVAIREGSKPSIIENFLSEYGLSTEEGVALMCLAEALLRVPDAPTMDALIEDKIAPSDWGKHLGQAASSLVNASTWALLFTGRVLETNTPGIGGVLRSAVKRLGEPVIRSAVKRAVQEMARQFVLGETIEGALKRGSGMMAKGYSYSFDMLGEAALTEDDALKHFEDYATAIRTIGHQESPQAGAGISVKLSALYARYEPAQKAKVMEILLPRVKELVLMAKERNMGFNIDAEEAARLDILLDITEALISDPDLGDWTGFGFVVQAYGQRASYVIDWLAALSNTHNRPIMVRLVKGAYWDTEIKHAQELGLTGYAVFTTKPATDISYIACARRLFAAGDTIFPQFATHNAHTIVAIRTIAPKGARYEFQRLHGMGESVHERVRETYGDACRIYAPVGTHKDLLAYLVRRLLENGANSSFVNQIVDSSVPASEVAADPFSLETTSTLPTGDALFQPERRNSAGIDFDYPPDLAKTLAARAPFMKSSFTAAPTNATDLTTGEDVQNPNDFSDIVGTVHHASPEQIEDAFAQAKPWEALHPERILVLNRAADLFEEEVGQVFAILAREAGKTLPDCLAELREAVDFIRYYAVQAQASPQPAVGIFACVSPWNFPLAIFTGQIVAALSTGNAVLAKPAESTPLIAALAVSLFHKAGVPKSALQLLPGTGATVGQALTSDPRVDGVCFTGSTGTAHRIRKNIANNLSTGAPLVAETGGINAMIVDSTALMEQAVSDVIASAFQSAGQRCSALRCVYVQSDVAQEFETMIAGAMDLLNIGDPADISTDIGPVISEVARKSIQDYIDEARTNGRVMKELARPENGHFVGPTLLKTPGGLKDMPREVFGPVLHYTTFNSEDFERVLADVNASGYGLTFGLHSRIDARVEVVKATLNVGNLYVNRNQIGAIVGSQPFGGEGLSGTGPKAGGPYYLARFTRPNAPDDQEPREPYVDEPTPYGTGEIFPLPERLLPGPTGEANTLWTSPRAPLLCLGPSVAAQNAQAAAVQALGGAAIVGRLAPQQLTDLEGISGAIYWGDHSDPEARAYVQALSEREGPILPFITSHPDIAHALHERHLCVDTTAAGGNAALLAEGGL